MPSSAFNPTAPALARPLQWPRAVSPSSALPPLPPAAAGGCAARARRAVRTVTGTMGVYFIPVILWLLLFSCGVALIPDAARPRINVTLLPRIDAAMGHSVHWFSNEGGHPNVDLLAAVPYTVHSVLPLAYIASTMWLAPREQHRHLLRFVFVFGLMNLAAVLTHLAFPTAPPWYLLKRGTEAASYAMKGDPAVLGRVDERFDMQLYHRMYAEGGKVVFGAWPSLHAAWPYLMARFRPRIPGRVVCAMQVAYAALVWWAAIYLQHHYAVDVLGGVLYAEMALAAARMLGVGAERTGYKRVAGSDPALPVVGKL